MACRNILCDSCMTLKDLRPELERMKIKIPFSSDARRAAKRMGWFSVRDRKTNEVKDYCPSCAKAKGLTKDIDKKLESG